MFRTGHPKSCSASPANVNVLLVCYWHVLVPDRFLQSKYFGEKRAQQPDLQMQEFTEHSVLKGTAVPLRKVTLFLIQSYQAGGMRANK